MRRYRIVDKTAPRFRLSKFRYTVLNRELFDKFKEKYPNIKMDYLVFKDIVCAINEEFISYVINNKEGVFLPCGMGKIYLCMYPPKERYLNDVVKREQGIHSTHFNFHSSDFVGKITWIMDGVKYKTDNTEFYGFIGHRNFKTRASNAFKTQPELYIREARMIRAHEHYKRKNNERAKANSEISDQPSEDAEQGS